MKRDTYLILHDIRSIHNVGSIFRTADCAAVKKIFLTGYTPAPVDRFGRVLKDFAKVSLGAENSVSWEKADRITDCIAGCKEKRMQVVAVEQDEQSVDYKTWSPGGSVAYILGNEPDGLSKEVLAACDVIIEISMHGSKESLNVSVAAGIILFNNL